MATMLEDETKYPTVADPKDWKLKDNDKIVYIAVDMDKWLAKNAKTVRRSISVPEYLSKLANEQNINVSRLTTEALKKKLGL